MPVPGGENPGGVDGDADFASLAKRGSAAKGDDVRRRRIVEKRGVQAGQRGIGEKGDGQFSSRDRMEARWGACEV